MSSFDCFFTITSLLPKSFFTESEGWNQLAVNIKELQFALQLWLHFLQSVHKLWLLDQHMYI